MIDKLGPLGRELRAIWMLLFVAVLLFIATPDFLVTANLLNVLLAATVTALLGAGQTFVIIQGEIDLSVGAVLGLSGVTTALVLQDHSLVVGLGAGLLVGCVAGLVNGLLVTKTRMPSFIATLAMMSVVAGLTLRITEGNPVAVADEGFRAIGRAKPLGVPLPILIMLVVFVVFGLLLSRSRFGRYVYAVGDNPEAARLSGIPVDRVKISAFVISGLLAAIGGFILTARLSTAQPTAGSGLELAAIAAVIIGGTSLAGVAAPSSARRSAPCCSAPSTTDSTCSTSRPSSRTSSRGSSSSSPSTSTATARSCAAWCAAPPRHDAATRPRPRSASPPARTPCTTRPHAPPTHAPPTQIGAPPCDCPRDPPCGPPPSRSSPPARCCSPDAAAGRRRPPTTRPPRS